MEISMAQVPIDNIAKQLKGTIANFQVKEFKWMSVRYQEAYISKPP
jgi:hypothetical protein